MILRQPHACVIHANACTLLVDGVVDGEDDGHVALLRVEALGLVMNVGARDD